MEIHEPLHSASDAGLEVVVHLDSRAVSDPLGAHSDTEVITSQPGLSSSPNAAPWEELSAGELSGAAPAARGVSSPIVRS